MNDPGCVLVTGNTYPVRADIKALGARWDDRQQGWQVPAAFAQVARDLVASAGPVDPAFERNRRSYRRPSRYRSTYTRFSSGAEVYTNKNGRCEDAPCCGCCS